MDTALEAHALLKQKAARVAEAKLQMERARQKMRDHITRALVNQYASISDLAKAAKVKRNYVDRIKSASEAAPLRGSRSENVVVPKVEYSPQVAGNVLAAVARAATAYSTAKESYKEALVSRDALMSEIYRLRLMGPTEIGRSVELDRNSVMRITRTAGVPRMRDDASGAVAS